MKEHEHGGEEGDFEYDHEAFLGDQAEEFDELSPGSNTFFQVSTSLFTFLSFLVPGNTFSFPCKLFFFFYLFYSYYLFSFYLVSMDLYHFTE